ncbi:GntR family transcriptional regulator [Dactylosporangium sp. NPDC050688]|uniref:GntR family transcriptional regulator n=1 Tax=Dactylosporangium sp. NPDC050688 TaxID=3157217 RepID=UPI00340B3067
MNTTSYDMTGSVGLMGADNRPRRVAGQSPAPAPGRAPRLPAARTQTSRREEILVELREAIVTGRLQAGEQLKQDDIAERYGSSPGPVREALRQLVSEGLAEHHPNRGSFVSYVSTEEMLEVFLPIRVAAENYAFRKISHDLDDQLMLALEEQIAEMEVGAAAGDMAAVIEADVRFHALAVHAAGSVHVSQLWESVLSRIRVLLYRLAPQHGTLGEIVAEHRLLYGALQSGNATLIRTVVECHILGSSSTLLVSEWTSIEGKPAP